MMEWWNEKPIYAFGLLRYRINMKSLETVCLVLRIFYLLQLTLSISINALARNVKLAKLYPFLVFILTLPVPN